MTMPSTTMSSTRIPWRCALSWRCAGALALTVALLAACGGGSSDVVGGDGRGDADTTLILVAYAVAEPGWSKIIPAFAASPQGQDMAVTASYGASADQSRAVLDGKPADLVNFSVEPDMDRLVEADEVAKDWNADAALGGSPFGSVVSLVVRKGNPKGIKDWDDLLAPGVEVVTPSPLSSGSAKWNLLAPYAVKSDGGKDAQAGLDFVDELVTGHIKTRPSSAREATNLFLMGTGDVLLSYENEAIDTERRGKPIEYVIPPQTFKIENPVAVVAGSAHREKANALKNFLYTDQGQRVWAQAGFRPVNPAVAEQFATEFPAPEKLWTIADLGGWAVVDPALFDKDNGTITRIYKRATG